MTETPIAALVDPRHTAILVVDVQPLFTEGTLQPPADQVLPALQRFLAAARGAHVLHVFLRFMRAAAPSERWKAVWQKQHGADLMDLAAPGSPKVAYAPGFEPEAGDLEMTKDRYSAFLGTSLADDLRRRAIETVIVAGLTTAVCVSSTARDAFQLDFDTITLSDCCAERNLEEHEAALQTLGRAFGRVCSSHDVVAAWQTGHTTAAAESVEQAHEEHIRPQEPQSALGDGHTASPQ
jgi:nicotinamidase-related amidase